MTLRISAKFKEAIVEHARAEEPDEACGVILGPIGSDDARRMKPMVNAAHSPTFYEFDPMDLLHLYREMDETAEEIVVIYHSHPTSEARPSSSDVAYAGEPSAHYVLVSTRNEIFPDVEFRSFRIVDGVVSEEEILITN